MRANTHYLLETEPNGVSRLTIANAGKANILSSATITALTEALQRIAEQPGLRVLVLTGAGERNFIGGADIGEMATLNPTSAEAFISRLAGFCEAVRHFLVPVVARIQGPCLGGGLEIALACDIRVAAPGARFGLPEVRLGIPSVIHAALLPRFIGLGRARHLILTGEVIDASTALQWGLVDVVSENASLDTAVADTVASILSCGREVIASQKALLREWEERPLGESVDFSIAAFGRAFTTGEPQRDMQAFLDAKRRRHPAR